MTLRWGQCAYQGTYLWQGEGHTHDVHIAASASTLACSSTSARVSSAQQTPLSCSSSPDERPQTDRWGVAVAVAVALICLIELFIGFFEGGWAPNHELAGVVDRGSK
jgi:hypothetical protein